MNKKVIDILPPKEAKSQKQSQLRILKTSVSGSRVSRVSLFSSKKFLSGLFLIFTIIVFSYVHFVLDRAKIEIWPETEFLTFETELTVDGQIKEPDFLAKIIPAEIFEADELVSRKFTATGSVLVERRAEGTLRLFNNFSTAVLPLVSQTQFISADGKLFRTPIRVVIPGRRREAGEWVPGTVDIRVVADQPGEEFNIGSSVFSIPGLRGTPLFITVYGRSFKPMTGGKSKRVAQVSQRDLDQAKDIINEKATTVCAAALKGAIPNEFGFLEQALETEIIEGSAGVRVGAKVEEFNFQARANCRILAFKKEDIRNFAIDFITVQLVENRKIVPESLEINYSLEEVDIEGARMALSLVLTADVYSVIDQIFLQNELRGKSLIEAQTLLGELLQADRVDVNLWPFWIRNIPKDLERIEIELKFD